MPKGIYERKKKYEYPVYWEHAKNETNRIKELKSPPLNVLNLLFDYDAETGSFKKKFSMQHGVIEPREPKSSDGNGYLTVGITDSTGKTRLYRIHRLVYVMHTGEKIPPGITVDHKNGIPDDNRFENLRLVSQKVNSRNKKRFNRNTSGYTGVSFNKEKDKWTSYIRIDGKLKYLGSYETAELAYQARLEYVGRFNLHNLGEAFSYRHTNDSSNGVTIEDMNQK